MSATLKDILDLPGNRPVFDALTELLRDPKAVAFVGAGASAGLYPTWANFIDQLAEYAVAQGKAELKDAERWKKDTASNPQQRVNTIVRKLTEPLYRDFLKATFAPRRGADGKRYTAAHAALLRLPFRGYVTTNYDPALDFARAELRPETLSTGTPTWQDDNEVYLWRTGDVFTSYDCPMLWLHGYWQRPDGIVLNSGEYTHAYKPGIYRDTFRELWIRERLVFLGFGFNDPQFTFMVGEFLRDLSAANAAPRHIALLGWPGIPDPDEIAEKRDNLEADYHLRALFYPTSKGDHSALHTLLAHLASTISSPSPLKGERAGVRGLPPIPQKWVHETTNDDKFIGREDELDRLNRWVRDDPVRIIAICAVGGTGKTALVGHWLKNTTGWRTRPFIGLFAWSFYQNRDTDEFLKALLQWARETFGTTQPNENADLINAAAQLLRERSLLLVIDGLEVLQEGPNEFRHGAFLGAALRDLLYTLCEDHDSRSMTVLTSRFTFADLERHLGTAFLQLEIHGLSADQGAALLREFDVRGSALDREEVSRCLDGHPLALRVFAESLPNSERVQPLVFLNHAFKFKSSGGLRNTPLNDKLRRLLSFYDENLPREHAQLLSVVSLFRSPVAERTILRLICGLFSNRRHQKDTKNNRRETRPVISADEACGISTLSGTLAILHGRGILSREPIREGHGYACHPILRDHFRSALLGAGPETARHAADLLMGRPSEKQPESVDEIEPALVAIELLLDTGDFAAADRLYRERLDDGQVFKSMPALSEGLRCTLGFVRDKGRCQRCEEALSTIRFWFYLNYVGFLAGYSGQSELSVRFFDHCIAEAEKLQSKIAHCAALLNRADVIIFNGRLSEAKVNCEEAVRLAKRLIDGRLLWKTFLYRGWVTSFSGPLSSVALDFALAIALEKSDHQHTKVSHVGFWTTELLVRTGHNLLGIDRVMLTLPFSERTGNNDYSAYCLLMRGRCFLSEGHLKDAESDLHRAEEIFESGQMLFWLARLHVVMGDLAIKNSNPTTAYHHIAAALALAQPRGMRLVHADALVLRGRARLLEAKPDAPVRALDDATDALRLARDCGYAWAERDALFLEAQARTGLVSLYAQTDPPRATRERTAAAKAHSEAEALAAKLTLTEADLAAAEAEARVWLANWENEKKKP